MRISLLAVVTIGFSASTASLPVFAQQYPCPAGPGPGQVQVGQTQGGNGIASVPLCVSSGSGQQGSSSDPFDMKNFRLPPPSPPRQVNVWRYFEAENGACKAMFTAENGYIIIELPLAPTAARPPVLRFSSDIATADVRGKAEAVDVSLLQSSPGRDATPQRVKAVHNLRGEYVFSLQSNAAALEGIDDRMTFQALVAGKPVVDMRWIDGERTKSELARCLETSR